MPKQFLRRFLPDHHFIQNHQHLRFLGTLLHDPNLLHLNRRSVAGGFSVGLFVAFVPIPFQMVLAAFIAILIRVNLPLSVILVWLTNPLTMPPLFFFAYKVGAWILNRPPRKIQFEPTLHWLTEKLGAIWEPFLLGCFLLALGSALLGNILVRLTWRFVVVRNWKARQKKRVTETV